MELVLWPDPRLSQVSEPVTEFDDELGKLINDMTQLMLDNDGAGLAAVQVGVLRRVFVLGNYHGFNEYVNPRIVLKSESLIAMPEGCLSFPSVYDRIERPSTVQVEWQTRTGAARQDVLTGFWARCFQHEVDHLDGITFDSYMTSTAQKVLRKRARRATRG